MHDLVFLNRAENRLLIWNWAVQCVSCISSVLHILEYISTELPRIRMMSAFSVYYPAMCKRFRNKTVLPGFWNFVVLYGFRRSYVSPIYIYIYMYEALINYLFGVEYSETKLFATRWTAICGKAYRMLYILRTSLSFPHQLLTNALYFSFTAETL